MIKIKTIFYLAVLFLLILSLSSGFSAYTFIDMDRSNNIELSGSSEGIIDIFNASTVTAEQENWLVDIYNPTNSSQNINIVLNSNGWTFPDGSTSSQKLALQKSQVSFNVTVSDSVKNGEQLSYTIEAYGENNEYLLTKNKTIEAINPIFNIDGQVKAAGGSGKLTIDISNTGDTNATITDITIEKTSSPADKIGKGDLISIDNNQVYFGNEILFGNRVDITNTGLNKSQTISIDFDRFLDGNKNVKMDGESVTLTFGFQNYGSQTIKITGN